MVMTQASNRPPTLYELPHELHGTRVCLRPYSAGGGVAVQAAIEESRDHQLPGIDVIEIPERERLHLHEQRFTLIARQTLPRLDGEQIVGESK